jgi:hypothetical protein
MDQLPNWVSALGGVLAAAVGLIAKHGYDRAKSEAVREDLGRLQAAHGRLKEEHDAFKLEVAQRYTTTEAVHQMETRLLAAIGGWGAQVERLTDRIERLFQPVSGKE